MGVDPSLNEDGAAPHIFDGLRASVFEAYQKWRRLDAHHIDDFHAFCDAIPDLVAHLSPYCIVNNADDPEIIKLTAWDLEFVSIDYSPDMKRVEWVAPHHIDDMDMDMDKEYEKVPVTVFFKQTPQSARENLTNYVIHVLVKVRRRVYTTAHGLAPHIRMQINTKINNEKRDNDTGCWLMSNFDKCTWRMLNEYLHYRPEYSGYQGSREGDVYRLSVPRVVGSRECVLSPEARKHYTLQDYYRLREDPYDFTGYVIVKGMEKTWRTQKIAPCNQITIQADATSKRPRVQAMMWVHTAAMNPLDKQSCSVSAANLFGTAAKKHAAHTNAKNTASSTRKRLDTLKKRISDHKAGKKKNTKQTIIDEKDRHVLFQAAWLRGRLPLPVIFYALGVCTDKEILLLMGATVERLHHDDNGHFERCVVASIAAARSVCKITHTMSYATMQYLAQRKIVNMTNFKHDYIEKHVREELVTYMFEDRVLRTMLLAHIAPHAEARPQPELGVDRPQVRTPNVDSIYDSESVKLKIMTLSSMCTRVMLCVCGQIEPDDRDNLEQKRTSGLNLYMQHQFLVGLRHALKDATKEQAKIYKKRCWDLDNCMLLEYPYSGFKFKILTDKMVYMFNTGNVKVNRDWQSGFTERTDRLSRLATLSQLRGLQAGGNSNSGGNNRNTKKRAHHTSKWGMECAIETPEGTACGLTTYLACTAYLSPYLSHEHKELVRTFLAEHPLIAHTGRMSEKDHTDKQTAFFCNESMDAYLHTRSSRRPIDVQASARVSMRDPVDTMPTFHVLVDGICIGFCHITDIADLCESVNDFRRRDIALCGVSVSYNLDSHTVTVLTDANRFMRPIFVVTGGRENRIPIHPAVALIMSGGTAADQRMLTWAYFWHTGTVDLIDVASEQNAMIATMPEDLFGARIDQSQLTKETAANKMCCFTHMEIDRIIVLGVNGCNIWFVTHSPTPRTTYATGMEKQSTGVALFNAKFTTSRGRTLELMYPQQPFVMTRGMSISMANEMPNGQNLIVAIMCHPYAQEDAIVFNQHSIDRGLLRSLLTECFTETETRGRPPHRIGQIRICNPNLESLGEVIAESNNKDEMRAMRISRDEDGLPYVGQIIHPNNTLFCTVVKRHDPRTKRIVWLYRPVRYKKNFPARVSRIQVRDIDRQHTTRGSFLRQVTIYLTLVVTPTVGNKFAATPGQKGICSLLVSSENMPWSADGIVPDLIIGPHAIPSRMTIGTILELFVSTIAAKTGMRFNGTPFRTGKGVDYLLQVASLAKLAKFNEVVLHDARTGRPLKQTIYMGSCYIRSLKHFVFDKIHSRSRGAVQMLSRQPTAGKVNDGGQRFGEMERDCVISHGATQFLKDRLFYNSDACRVHVCEGCGLIAVANLKKKVFGCMGCVKETKISQIHIPYGCKLLFQELMSMNIIPHMMLASGNAHD